MQNWLEILERFFAALFALLAAATTPVATPIPVIDPTPIAQQTCDSLWDAYRQASVTLREHPGDIDVLLEWDRARSNAEACNDDG